MKKFCIKTSTGRVFDFENPHPSMICAIDIAAGLSRICRFGGQLTYNKFYSVAEHSILCAEEARKDGIDPHIRMAILLHDATEAYCGDVVKPLKNLLGESYARIEKIVENVIGERFDVDFDKYHDIIKKYDTEMLTAEQKFLFSPEEHWLNEPSERVLHPEFKLYSHKKARKKFINYFLSLQKERNA